MNLILIAFLCILFFILLATTDSEDFRGVSAALFFGLGLVSFALALLGGASFRDILLLNSHFYYIKAIFGGHFCIIFSIIVLIKCG